MNYTGVMSELDKHFKGRKFVTKREVAGYLNMSVGTLDRWIRNGGGIPYTKRGTGLHERGGRVLYHISDIAEYVLNERTQTA